MKILDRNQLGTSGAGSVENANSAEAVAGRRDGAQAGKTASGEDQAEVSGLAEKLGEAASAQSVERAARVEKLRAAVASGNYRVDPLEVSRSLIKEAVAEGAAVSGTDAGSAGPEGSK